MPTKMYKDTFTNERRRAWCRSRSQAWFRKEEWELTFSEFCQFWTTEELWARRGRKTDDLVLTRRDPEKPWNRDNCCLLQRNAHLRSAIAARAGEDITEFFADAIGYGGKRYV